MSQSGSTIQPVPKSEKVPFWVARAWQGMNMSAWYRLLCRHRFAVSPARLGTIFRISMFSIANSGLGLWEKWTYGEGIRQTKIKNHPLFVIGHWRTGTTWLHELITRDEQFAFPTTYQCLAPHHFLLTQDWLPRILRHMLPRTRPMDNMEVGWDKPQEDEFAICCLGLPSPYLQWAFPKLPGRYDSYLELDDIPESERELWKRKFHSFLQHLTYGDHRRQVLKSPTHTARIRTLLEVFPEAQFIHIVRNPYVVYSSTIRTWQRLWDMMGLHEPDYRGIEEFVLQTFSRMFRKYEQDKALLKPNQLVEVRYEDLVRDIPGQMQRIYDQLGLAHFDRARPNLQKYVDARKDYQTNRFTLPPETRQMISERWADYIQRYGYDSE
jgi:hypothetical protein